MSFSDIDVEVIRISPVTHGSNLHVLVDVRIGNIEIKNFRVIQQPGMRSYVSAPQMEYTRANGSKGYFPVVKICDKQKRQLVAEVVLKACRKSGMVLSD